MYGSVQYHIIDDNGDLACCLMYNRK